MTARSRGAQACALQRLGGRGGPRLPTDWLGPPALARWTAEEVQDQECWRIGERWRIGEWLIMASGIAEGTNRGADGIEEGGGAHAGQSALQRRACRHIAQELDLQRRLHWLERTGIPWHAAAGLLGGRPPSPAEQGGMPRGASGAALSDKQEAAEMDFGSE